MTGSMHLAESILHLDDTDTAIKFPAGDTVSVETAGSERMRITSGGSALFGGLTSQDGSTDTSKLAVQGGGSNIGIIQVHAGGGESAGDLSGITFSHGADDTTARAKCAIASSATGSYGKGDLCFYVDGANDNNQVAAADEKLRITNDDLLKFAGNMQFTAANPELEFNNGGPRFRVPAANTLAGIVTPPVVMLTCFPASAATSE